MLVSSYWLKAKRVHIENLFAEAKENQKRYNEIFNSSETLCAEKFLLTGIPFLVWTIVKKKDFLKFRECFFKIYDENNAILALIESREE